MREARRPAKGVYPADHHIRMNHRYMAVADPGVWRLGAGDEHLQNARGLFLAMIRAEKRTEDFFAVRPWLQVYRELREAGVLPAAEDEAFRSEVVPSLVRPRDRGDHNRAALNAAGLALALEL